MARVFFDGSDPATATFAVHPATSLLAALLVAALLPSLPTQRVARAWRAALHRRLLAWTGLACVPTTLVMVVVLMLPVVVERAGEPPSTTAWLLVAGAVSALLTQRLLARWELRLPARTVLAAVRRSPAAVCRRPLRRAV